MLFDRQLVREKGPTDVPEPRRIPQGALGHPDEGFPVRALGESAVNAARGLARQQRGFVDVP